MNIPKIRPVTYASEKRARDYVASLKRGVGQPVYLTVNPSIRTDKTRWPEILQILRELLPYVQFRIWSQVEAEARQSLSAVQYVTANHAGNVLIGRRHGGTLRVGPVGLAESTSFAKSGKPVFVFTGSRLIAWPDCQILKIPADKRKNPRVAAYVLLPVRPEGKPLPTLAASFHALGMWNVQDIGRAAGIIPEGKPGEIPPVRWQAPAPSPLRGPERPPERPGGTFGGVRMVTDIRTNREVL